MEGWHVIERMRSMEARTHRRTALGPRCPGRPVAALAVAAALGGGVWLAAPADPASAAPSQITLAFTGLNGPFAVAVDANDDVFVADTGNNRVLELPAGSASQVTLPFTGLNGPRGVAVDAAGDVFVADFGNNRVLELPAGSAGQVTLPFTGLNGPFGVAVDAAGNVYVTDVGNKRALELPAGSAGQVTLPFTGLGLPTGVAVDAAGNVAVADSLSNLVLGLAAGSASPFSLPYFGVTPQGVALDQADDVFVAEFGDARVVEVLRAVTQVTLPFTGLNTPRGVAVDAAGNVFVADTGNNRVVELSTTTSEADLAITPPPDITTDATGPAGATVSYPLPAVADPDDASPPAPSCAPASGTVFAIGTTTVTCTAADADDANGPVSASFTITVTGAAAELADLAADVHGVGPGDSLADKVAQARADLAAGDITGACETLAGFIGEVTGQSGKTIPASKAAALIAAALQVRAVLDC